MNGEGVWGRDRNETKRKTQGEVERQKESENKEGGSVQWVLSECVRVALLPTSPLSPRLWLLEQILTHPHCISQS